MRVKIFPADRSGCGYYRCIFPARAVQASGNERVEVFVVDDDENQDMILNAKFGGTVGRPQIFEIDNPECDVLVLQRPMDRKLVEAIPLIQAHGTAVVVEIDDDFDTLSPKNPAFRAASPRFSPESNSMWFGLALQTCDYVITSTEALLKRYGQRGNACSISNYVPESYFKTEPYTKGIREDLWIGWPGNPFSHPGDLEVVSTSVRDVMREHDSTWLYTVGHDSTISRFQCDEFTPARTHVAHWSPLLEHAQSTCELDVGLAPLSRVPFNTAKSWIKPLEYAALGVPFVASPTREYRRLQKLTGVGEMAEYPIDWKLSLGKLVSDDDYRAERAALQREAVRTLTYEEHLDEWVNAWSMAMAYRSAR